MLRNRSEQENNHQVNFHSRSEIVGQKGREEQFEIIP